MQILSGNKRQITLYEWKEELQKHIKQLNEQMMCFEKFADKESLDWIIEDCEKLKHTAENAKKAIEFMDKHNIT